MKEVDNESKAEIASCIKLHLIINHSYMLLSTQLRPNIEWVL